jgi:hypothetical protein
MEVAYLAVTEKRIRGCDRDVVAKPDRSFGGMRHRARPLFNVSQGKDAPRKGGLHLGRGVLILLNVRGPGRRAWARAGALGQSGFALDLGLVRGISRQGSPLYPRLRTAINYPLTNVIPRQCARHRSITEPAKRRIGT